MGKWLDANGKCRQLGWAGKELGWLAGAGLAGWGAGDRWLEIRLGAGWPGDVDWGLGAGLVGCLVGCLVIW